MSKSLVISHHDQLLALRAGGQVRRFHTVPVLNRVDTNAQHSHGVALLCMAFWADTSCRLLKAAVLHDLTEGITGDMPHTLKRDDAELNRLYEQTEERAQQALGTEEIMAELTDEEVVRLRVADLADAFLFAREEYMSGNHTIGYTVMRTQLLALDHFPGVAPFWFMSWARSLTQDLNPSGL